MTTETKVEAVAWTTDRPAVEGAYYVRGFNLFRNDQYEALVQVRMHHYGGEPLEELCCNLHSSTSEDDMDDWIPIVDMSGEFQWLGPLIPSSALDALRGEVAAAYAAVESKAGWEWKRKAEEAERRVAELEGAIEAALTIINKEVDPKLYPVAEQSIRDALSKETP